MAENLRDQGFAVYLIDVHSAEGVLTACAGEIQKECIAQYIDKSIAWVHEQEAAEASWREILTFLSAND